MTDSEHIQTLQALVAALQEQVDAQAKLLTEVRSYLKLDR